MTGVVVRHGQAGDAARLAVLASQVWLHTYADAGISAEIADYVLDAFTPARYAALLTDPGKSVLVAERGGNLLGFAVVAFGQRCPDADAARAELETLYVQEHCHRQGLGRALLRAAENAARQLAASPLWLTVNSRNTRASAFYLAHGYRKVGTAEFLLSQTRHANDVLLGTP
ncbi:GNAT family N-acetyltransferase [Chitinilyticum litopenaei]|uniref:GNAT family N-acetyltransferase n=1 Tax=Chitinilyticum litopenaei TaxID=1121276 RepID=UPI0004084477|nr:GNAT family N-acetyltransferase [Chitinilyticum litopenaei]